MNDPFQMQRELRYGAPVCDQILTGRHFTIGYSWYFRQAKWVLEIINPLERLLDREFADGERQDNFRADQRIPWRFRASLGAYKGSGYDRGHLVASADQRETELQNSETFLLSNMSPQKPGLNRKIWRHLEEAIRDLDAQDDIMETYVLTAPVFDFGKVIETIGDRESKHGIDIPIPHGFVKSVFAEHKNGGFKLWTFKIDNEEGQDDDLGSYLIKTYDAEQYVGGRFWDRVAGGDLHDQKKTKGRMWTSVTKGPFTQSSLMRMKETDVVKIANKMGLNASVADNKADTIAKILARQDT
ncbi:DNA/RNA non-specific endonuclease [Coralliovum pocilloporae]|uniref:DNA/RNA non-specific endonuclease n=1 Tax=Coralliovum pocilloporae TaxID=3066369 RepID=UPI003307A03F